MKLVDGVVSCDIAFLKVSIIICVSTIFSTSTLSSMILSAKCPSWFKYEKRASDFSCPPVLNTFHILFPASRLCIYPHWLWLFVHLHIDNILFSFWSPPFLLTDCFSGKKGGLLHLGIRSPLKKRKNKNTSLATLAYFSLHLKQ